MRSKADETFVIVKTFRTCFTFFSSGEILYVLIDLTTISLTSPENEVLVLDYCYAADTTESKTPIYDFIVEGLV